MVVTPPLPSRTTPTFRYHPTPTLSHTNIQPLHTPSPQINPPTSNTHTHTHFTSCASSRPSPHLLGPRVVAPQPTHAYEPSPLSLPLCPPGKLYCFPSCPAPALPPLVPYRGARAFCRCEACRRVRAASSGLHPATRSSSSPCCLLGPLCGPTAPLRSLSSFALSPSLGDVGLLLRRLLVPSRPCCRLCSPVFFALPLAGSAFLRPYCSSLPPPLPGQAP